MESLLNKLAFNWRLEGIRFHKGELQEKISAFENSISYFFPNEFIQYLQTINGMLDGEADRALFYFWSLDLMVNEFKKNNLLQQESVLIGFADRIVIETIYMIELSKTRQATGRIYIKRREIEYIFPDFRSFLEDYLNCFTLSTPFLYEKVSINY